MDSVAEFLKSVNQQDKQERIDRLKNNRFVKSRLLSRGMKPEYLESHTAVIERWLDTINHCSRCKGLSYCSEKTNGYANGIQVDSSGDIEEILLPCKHMKDYAAKRAHARRYSVSHIDDEGLLLDFFELAPPVDDDSWGLAYNALAQSLENPKGIFLYGQPGTGKTWLMMALANSIARNKDQGMIAFINLPRLIADLKESFNESGYQKSVLSNLLRAEILFIDDIGAESISEWERDDILFPLLDERMKKKRKTYFTSNYSPAEIKALYESISSSNSKIAALRLMERISALAAPCELLGASLR